MSRTVIDEDLPATFITQNLQAKPVNDDEAKAMMEEPILLQTVSKKALINDKAKLIAYRYLYWACFRNFLFVSYHVVSSFGISPFLAVDDDRKSPFLIAIENNQQSVVQMMLNKEWIYKADSRLIKQQMNSTDVYGNNALHKACRFRNPEMIKLLLEKNISDIK